MEPEANHGETMKEELRVVKSCLEVKPMDINVEQARASVDGEVAEPSPEEVEEILRGAEVELS